VNKIITIKKILIFLSISFYIILFFNYKIFPYQKIKLYKNTYIDPFYIHQFYKKEALKCVNQKVSYPNNSEEYNFFIAGHTYGIPNKKVRGFYKSFYRSISKNKKYNFGILAGDFVQEPNEESWDAIDKQISSLNYKIYIVAGNHDYNDENFHLYEERYGKTFYNFKYKKDLFIILDSNLNNLNIVNEQLEFLKNTINSEKFNNLYIVSHHMIWMFNDKVFNSNKNSKFNFKSTYQPDDFKTNFWDEVAPLLLKLEKNIYLVSGNIGQFPRHRSVYCKQFKNIKFLSTGMGGEKYDNYLIFKKNNQKIQIDFKYF
tara:strand:- start:3916 stop:4860 length:945 start_codon:yes stop_codon:yes gene_type:complete